jgi:LmbE family N-acetylglucosaminyl deacetylase
MKLPSDLSAVLDTSVPIYALSPHIDDVIWSTGGFLQYLAKAEYEITLVSIFSHSIYVYDDIRPPVEATHIRKGEDYTAALAAGFKNVIFLDFPDGILRDTPQTEVINAAYETPPYLLNMVTDCLTRIVPHNAMLIVPAGFGGHMDHLTTRRAALPLRQPKILYCDLPYGTRGRDSEEVLKFLAKDWKNIQITLSPQVIEDHLKLFWYYQSQTSTEVAEEIETYLTNQGLNLWVPSNENV